MAGHARVAAAAVSLAVLASGMGARTLAADPPASPSAPIVQPGEPWIVYQWETPSAGIYLVRPDGTDNHPVLAEPGTDFQHPDWSPDGARIAYSVDWRDIRVAGADGSDPVVLSTCAAPCPDNIDLPAWSPDGTRVAYRRLIVAGGIYTGSAMDVVDVATGERTTLFETASPEFLEGLRWSPDGQRMVLELSHYGDGQQPVPVEGPLPDFKTAIAVVDLRDGPSAKPHIISSWDIHAASPDWNPADDRIVFGTYDLSDFNETDEASNLFTVGADGTDLKQITTFGREGNRATQPGWTPDGKRVIFTSIERSGYHNAQVGFVDADGGNLTHGLAAATPVYVTHPRLRPTP